MITHHTLCNEALKHLLIIRRTEIPAEKGEDSSSYQCLYWPALGSIKCAVILHPTKPMDLMLIYEIFHTGDCSVGLLLNHWLTENIANLNPLPSVCLLLPLPFLFGLL